MAKKLSAEDRPRLERALASWESWRPMPAKPPQVVDQLGGDSNRSFVVSDGASRWVLRLNNPLTDSGINRDNERLALLAAQEAGISPPSFQTGEFLVTPFVSGGQATLENLGSIGVLFSCIHAMPVQLEPIDLLRHLGNYYERANPDPLLHECYQRVVLLYPPSEVELKPCHNDCLLPNIIESEEGLRVIDWEYAAAADPAFDIAVFSRTYGLDRAGLELLLSGYGSRNVAETEGLLTRIRYFEKYYRLIELLWWGLRGRDRREDLEVLARELGVRS